MDIWANAVITDKGLDLQAKLIAGTTLTITRAVTGSGFVTPGLLSQQTAVTDIKQELQSGIVTYPGKGMCALPLSLSNEKLTEGYIANQVGVYAMDPDEGEILYFIAQSPDEKKGREVPSAAEIASYFAEWTFYFKFGQADSVTVLVDPAGATPKKQIESMIRIAIIDNGIPRITATSADGVEYVGELNGLASLKNGLCVVMIPTMTSTSTLPNLNLNDLGAKNIKQRLSINTSLTVQAERDDWLVAKKPVLLMFDGTQWVTGTSRPSAEDIYGEIPIENGGTGADNAADAIKNLGAAPAKHGHTLAELGAAAANHTHTLSQLGAAAANHTHTYSDVGAAPASHTHSEYATVNALNGKANANHTHSEYAAVNHTHSDYAAVKHTHSEYAASNHTHTPASIGAAPASHTHSEYATVSALNGKANANHTHTYSEVGAAAANHTHTPASIGAAPASHTHSVATPSSDGFMSAADKATLDNMDGMPFWVTVTAGADGILTANQSVTDVFNMIVSNKRLVIVHYDGAFWFPYGILRDSSKKTMDFMRQDGTKIAGWITTKGEDTWALR